jgi:hypothetical protein
MHILDRVVPARHELRELVQFLGQYGALDAGEAQQLRDAIGVLDGLCVPIALLKVVEDPHQTAAASLFSNTLRSRAPNDHDIDVAPPGMR